MKGAPQAFQLQKKIIIHLDVNNVLKINSNYKDFFVFYFLFRYTIYVRIGFGENYKKIAKKIHKRLQGGNYQFQLYLYSNHNHNPSLINNIYKSI